MGPLGKICPNSFGLSMLTCRVIKSELRHFSRSGKFAVTLQLPLVQGWGVVNVNLSGLLYREFHKIFKGIFSKEHLWVTDSKKRYRRKYFKKSVKKINLSGLSAREFHKMFKGIFSTEHFLVTDAEKKNLRKCQKKSVKKINLSGLFDREFHKTFNSIFQQDTSGRLILRK